MRSVLRNAPLPRCRPDAQAVCWWCSAKVQFRPGYRDIADTNRAFALMKMKHLFPPDASKLIPILQPGHHELVVDKDRFSAFSGNDLKEVLPPEASSPIPAQE